MVLNREAVMPLQILILNFVVIMIFIIGFWIWEEYRLRKLLERQVEYLAELLKGGDNDDKA
jgi:hypothetical protein